MSGEDDSSGWQLTESDPGVFTELLKTLGLPLIVDDLYSLDPESLAALQPIHALIFLFKYVNPTSTNTDTTRGVGAGGEPDPHFPGFFAHQTVNNACATLAVLNALGNIPSSSLPASSFATKPPNKSEEYTALMTFAGPLDPTSRGLVITSADWLREAHNALSPPSAISLDGLELEKGTEEAYHFVVYLPVAGALYELDGLKEFAVRHGGWETHGGAGWMDKASGVIESRIATYPDGALEFSLLALRDDPLPSLHAQLNAFQESGDQAKAAEVIVKLEAENNKRERWAFENSLRRHNHLGLLHAFLLALAKAGKLEAAKEGAKSVMKERRERAKENKAKALGGMDED
jgi:ubiquitin carboxyl-terminal hydrolase L5